MRHSRVRQKNRGSPPDFERDDLETPAAVLEPPETPENTAGKTSSPLPIQPVAERFPALEEQEVVLTFFAPEAKEVMVAGDFNNWRPQATPLTNLGEGNWEVRLMLRSGQYEYRFVVDGRWSDDAPASPRVPNPYGGFNSVVAVPLEDRESIL